MYDNANRCCARSRPIPTAAGRSHDPRPSTPTTTAGNKQTETDPRGNVTTFGYDNANRLTSLTAPDPDGGGPQTAPLTTYTYDVNGNLASTVEPRGNLQAAAAQARSAPATRTTPPVGC